MLFHIFYIFYIQTFLGLPCKDELFSCIYKENTAKISGTPLQSYNLSFAFQVIDDNSIALPDDVLKRFLVEKVYFVTLKNSTNKTKQDVKLEPSRRKT